MFALGWSSYHATSRLVSCWNVSQSDGVDMMGRVGCDG